MSPWLVRECYELERDVARTWWSLPAKTLLSLEDGRQCLLLYGGQPGGSAGPDVRDAVLRLLPREVEDEEVQLVGDVEFHLRASDWTAHGHQNDPRYNRVILHVVHYLDNATPAYRADGQSILACSLLDLPHLPSNRSTWPCQADPLSAPDLTSVLLYAGLRRFQEKSAALGQTLTQATSNSSWSVYDVCLIPALAEGLGYGRDRAFFRAAGLRLLGLNAPVPEPLGRASEPAPLDAKRLRILRTLIARWREDGAWQTLR